jgi:heme exporter protein A
MLAWENLSKSYGRRRLFTSLNGQINEGGLIAVTGPNGSGKSTFLKILAGLVRADAGDVRRPDGQRAIGYAAPDLSLYGELTGQENLEFFADVRGIDRKGVLPLLERAGLSRAAGKPALAYSSGMRQRLSLCNALLHQPAVLLLDEPTLALDSDGVAFVEQILAEHIQTGGCAVVATNDAGEAERWGPAGRIALDS